MDTKTKRIDPGNPAECERLIERGHLVLIAITSEAHAARVAAQKAELEVALSEARDGNANMLRNWLASYHGISDSLSVELSSVAPLSDSDTTTRNSTSSVGSGAAICKAPVILPLIDSPKQESLEPTLSWERLLPAARGRLETHSSQLQVSHRDGAVDTPSQLTQTSTTVVESELGSVGELGEFEVASKFTDNQQSEGVLPESEHTDGELPEGTLPEGDAPFVEEDLLVETDEPLVYQDLPELQVLAEAQRDLDKPFFRSGTRGLFVSVVVHVIAISTLMAITMQMPDPPASLGFDAGSSDSVAESFEVLQPIEITAPSEISPEMPSETAESSMSLPSAVGLSSTSVNAVSQATASQLSGVQASANRAVAAVSGRPNPSHANASFFGASGSGSCFCYVIDGSESMRGGPWEAAKAELLRSLTTMKESHRFYIVFFNQKLSAITMPGEREPATSPLYATPENLKHARNWIESLRIDRGAPPNDALLHAIELEPDAIYLLADGATKVDVPEFLRSKNRTSDFISGEQVRVPIHAIAFYSPESGQKLMKQVAAENKGQFIYVPDPRKK